MSVQQYSGWHYTYGYRSIQTPGQLRHANSQLRTSQLRPSWFMPPWFRPLLIQTFNSHFWITHSLGQLRLSDNIIHTHLNQTTTVPDPVQLVHSSRFWPPLFRHSNFPLHPLTWFFRESWIIRYIVHFYWYYENEPFWMQFREK